MADTTHDGKTQAEGLLMKYFVLKPKGDHLYALAARQAMLCYATYVEAVNPALALHLREWVYREAADV